MGKSEERSSVKIERVSPPRVQHSQELTDIHLYPDWATVKAFYSNGDPLQQPYFHTIVTDGYIPPHARSWTPPQASTPSSEGSLSKSAEKTDRGSTKKLSRLDGDAVPRGSYSAELEAKASVYDMSQSVGIDASSDGSNGKSGAHESEWSSYPTECRRKVHVQANTIPEYCIEVPVGPEILENNQVHVANGKVEPTKVCATEGLPFEVRVKERHLKRERRKQANRESARRSRLRKQAEYEALMETYESLKVKNIALKSELNQLIEDRDILKLENAAFMKKLNNSWAGQPPSQVQDQTMSNSNHPRKSADADESFQPSNLPIVRVKEEMVHAPDLRIHTLDQTAPKIQLKVTD